MTARPHLHPDHLHRHSLHRRRLLAAAALLPFARAGVAQGAWPTAPVRLISPYGAGGSNDILTRVLGEYCAEKLGQSFIVENKAGAGTRIANEFVARAPADGSVLLHAAAPIAIGGALYPKLPYDPVKSFAPISMTALAPLFLIVNAQSPFKTVDDLLKHGRTNPDGLTFGSPGAASAPHLTAELLFRAANVKGLNIHFRGDAAAYNELLAGRLDATLTAIATAMPHVQAGKLRVLAVANEERTPLYSSAPTLRESGLASVVGYGWYAMLAPAGTPAAVLERMGSTTHAALADAQVRRKAEAVGLQLQAGTPAQLTAFIEAEARKWSGLIKAAGITSE